MYHKGYPSNTPRNENDVIDGSGRLLAVGPALPLYDVTARKAHQWTMVLLIVLGFVLGDQVGWLPVTAAGAIMLVGRFWWPADVVRQFVWRVAVPAGWLPRVDRAEDRANRRVARTLGGLVWLASALLIVVGAATLGWVAAGLIGVMVVLDAALDFCALCFVLAILDRRGWLPAAFPHGLEHILPGER
jgi:hypothetical protein